MVTHTRTLLTFLIPYAQVGGAKSIPERISLLLKKFLDEKNFSGYSGNITQLFDYVVSQNIKAEKLFKGSLNIRLGSELHRRVAIAAEPSLLSQTELKILHLLSVIAHTSLTILITLLIS